MHLIVDTFCDMSSSPSDPSGAYILPTLATDDFIFSKDYLPTWYSCIYLPSTICTCRIVYYLAVPPTEHKRYLLLLISMYNQLLAR